MHTARRDFAPISQSVMANAGFSTRANSEIRHRTVNGNAQTDIGAHKHLVNPTSNNKFT